MLEERSTPMTAHEGDSEAIAQRGEVGRNEEKDIQR